MHPGMIGHKSQQRLKDKCNHETSVVSDHRHKKKLFTCAAASVRPHNALEPPLTESPNSGRLEFLALWEMPAIDSPKTCEQETRD